MCELRKLQVGLPLVMAGLLAWIPLQAQEPTPSGVALVGGGVVAAGEMTSGGALGFRGTVPAGGPSGATAGEQVALISGIDAVGTITVETMVRFALAAGWNIKAAPADTTQTLAQILTGTAGYPIKIGEAHAWDTASASYVALADGAPLMARQGFWVYSYWGGQSREIPAGRPDTVPLADRLEYGWNLFGPSFTQERPFDDSQIAEIWSWNADLQAYTEVPPGALLRAGEGYWILKLAGE